MLDLSSNNTVSSLRDVWNAGVRVLTLKATEGTGYAWGASPGFAQAWHALGGICGHYHFLHPGSPASAYAEADAFVAHVSGTLGRGDFVVVDAETKGESDAQVSAFIDRVHAHLPGVPGLEYSYQAFFAETPLRLHRAWQRWVAAYGPAAPGLGWQAWQFTQTGRVPGIVGDVDLSHIKRSLIEPTLTYGCRIFPVLDAKRALSHAGFGAGMSLTSMTYGPGMRYQLARFKRAHGWAKADATGSILGSRAWTALNQYL